MAKETRSQKYHREIGNISAIGLTPLQLSVIRKLGGATRLPAKYPQYYSRRTIEAVLQGRRSNPQMLLDAIENARDELKRVNEIMQSIEDLLCGKVTT